MATSHATAISEIERAEHDGPSQAKRTTPVTAAVRVAENSGDANIEYVGRAPIASATSDNVWQIMKVDCTSGTVITWADGNDSFDNIWDNRESLTYT